MNDKLEIKKGIHYSNYIQSAENIKVRRIAENQIKNCEDGYVFQIVNEWYDYHSGLAKSLGKPFVITSSTDLSKIDKSILEQLELQLCYEGETDNKSVRYAKFSQTRENIQSYL